MGTAAGTPAGAPSLQGTRWREQVWRQGSLAGVATQADDNNPVWAASHVGPDLRSHARAA